MVDSRTKNGTHNKKKEQSSRFSKSLLEKKEDKKEFPSVEISDDKKQKYFVNTPYFNFLHAEEELGFLFSDFAKNNFGEFIQTCYVVDLINLRKSYIMRNFVQVRFLAHKFKSPFGYFISKKLDYFVVRWSKIHVKISRMH